MTTDTNAIVTLPINDVRPSPENDLVYHPVDPACPEFVGLVNSVTKRGVLQPLAVTAERFIVSGHRRHAAARAAGLTHVPVTVLPISRANDLDAFVALLREHNRNRVKTHDKRVREELVGVDKAEAYAHLKEYRRRKTDMAGFSAAPTLTPGERIGRKRISEGKVDLVRTIVSVINERVDFWPVSDRGIHYGLLNAPPLRHTGKSDSRYANDRASYKDLTDVLTRMRLDRRIPWQALADSVATRSVPEPAMAVFRCFSASRSDSNDSGGWSWSNICPASVDQRGGSWQMGETGRAQRLSPAPTMMLARPMPCPSQSASERLLMCG